MLTIQRKLKEQPDSEWEFHEISLDKFPGGFQRESNWAVKYKRMNTDPKHKHEYKVELKT
jgi:hypothetical protein